jgi:hypothetical protein
MSSAEETSELVTSVIDDAVDATSGGLTKLSEITIEMSSEAVVVRLGEARELFDSGGAEAGEAAATLHDARTSAEQADAESVLELIDDAEDSLNTGREALSSTVNELDSEQAPATDWGSPSGSAGTTSAQPPPQLIYEASPKHGPVQRGRAAKRRRRRAESHGSRRTPGLRIAWGSRAFLAARRARAKGSGRWRS